VGDFEVAEASRDGAAGPATTIAVHRFVSADDADVAHVASALVRSTTVRRTEGVATGERQMRPPRAVGSHGKGSPGHRLRPGGTTFQPSELRADIRDRHHSEQRQQRRAS